VATSGSTTVIWKITVIIKTRKFILHLYYGYAELYYLLGIQFDIPYKAILSFRYYVTKTVLVAFIEIFCS